jgi:hypothetical protein
VSSNPPTKQSSGGFTGFLDKIGNTLSSFSPFAAKPKVTCPEPPPPVEEASSPVVATSKPKAPPKREVVEVQPPWELTVLVRCVDFNRQLDRVHTPDSRVTVELKSPGGSEVSVSIEKDGFVGGIGRAKASRAQGYDVKDTGHTEYEVTATADKWRMVMGKIAILDDGDKKDVTIDIRRLKWVAFRVVEDVIVEEADKEVTKEMLVAGVALDLTIPREGKRKETMEDHDLLIEYIDDDDTCSIDEMSEKEVWEVVSFTSE